MSAKSFLSLPRYALFAGAVALCGLPLYIHLPAFLALDYGINLQALGGLLLALRLLDFVQDPLLGWLLSRQAKRLNALALGACLVLAMGMVGLFAIPAPVAPLLWIAACLALAFTGFSLLSILIYADGVERGAADGHVRVATWRELGTLLGITLACLLPFLLPGNGYRGFAIFVAIALALAALFMHGQWQPVRFAMPSLRPLFRQRQMRFFLLLAFLNALPVAVTSTLFVFFVQFRLQAPDHAGLFLVLFFVCAALSTPLWRLAAKRFGARKTLVAGMGLAMLSFIWAFTLEAGDLAYFALVCIASGAALGADMMLLPALFSRYQSHAKISPALAFGFWNFCGKASLALAAGLVLPMLAWAGFAIDAPKTESALTALSFLYAIVPCGLKAIALALLLFAIEDETSADPAPISARKESMKAHTK
ncbi:MAG: MFS transporter [Cohaesibacter sp.]|nr:MFS transporter [Cohaesibacter sp.]